MIVKSVPIVDVSYLTPYLSRPIEAKEVARVPAEHLQLWCVQNAFYQIPTVELIEWLRRRIAGRHAIEIGSGNLCLGRYLGIRMTDSFIQQTPSVLAAYRAMEQEPCSPPADVERLEALEAVHKYKPEVVIASWVSQLGGPGPLHTSPHGANEVEIVAHADYIHVGNCAPHGDKIIRQFPHEEFSFPWLHGRAHDPSLNRIWCWPRFRQAVPKSSVE